MPGHDSQQKLEAKLQEREDNQLLIRFLGLVLFLSIVIWAYVDCEQTADINIVREEHHDLQEQIYELQDQQGLIRRPTQLEKLEEIR